MKQNLSHTLDPKENIPWQSGLQERGGFTIVWSCLAVIITCTWTTLHLTIPDAPNNDAWYKSVLRKIKWMIIMIICPEYVFAHAVLELRMALDDYLLMERYSEALKKTGWNIGVKTGARFVHSLLHGSKWPTMQRTNPNTTSPEVADTPTDPGQIPANNNHITQSHPSFKIDKRFPRERMWTPSHCYFVNMGGVRTKDPRARPAADPWDYRAYTRVCTARYLAKTLESMPGTGDYGIMTYIRISEDEIWDKSKADTFIRLLWTWEILRLLIEVSVRAVHHCPIAQLEIITLSFAVISLATVVVQYRKPKDVSQPMYSPDAMEHLPRRDLRLDSLSMDVFGSLVPTSWRMIDVRRTANDYFYDTSSNRKLFFTLFSVSTISFGLIHCGAWNFDFPTIMERWLWRGSAIASISMPVLMLMVKRLMEGILDRLIGLLMEAAPGLEFERRRKNMESWETIMVWAQIPGLVIYCSTRLAIIGISISCLRSAPRGMYWGTWTNFLLAIK